MDMNITKHSMCSKHINCLSQATKGGEIYLQWVRYFILHLTRLQHIYPLPPPPHSSFYMLTMYLFPQAHTTHLYEYFPYKSPALSHYTKPYQ